MAYLGKSDEVREPDKLAEARESNGPAEAWCGSLPRLVSQLRRLRCGSLTSRPREAEAWELDGPAETWRGSLLSQPRLVSQLRHGRLTS